MNNNLQFEPTLSNFLDESFSNGSGDKPKKVKKAKEPKPKKEKKSKSSRSDETYVGRSRSESVDRGRDDDRGSVESGSKQKLTSEKIQQGVDVATQIGGFASQLPKNQAKQDMKAVCGRRPLLRKNRASWDKCASDYAKNKSEQPSQDNKSQQNYNTSLPTEEKKFYQKPLFIVGVSAVVILGGFFIYKFTKKTPTPIPVIN